MAQTLGVRVVHIAERDTQVGAQHKVPGEFVNTWSVEGFCGEGCQPAELGEVLGVWSDWTPLNNRETLFDEPLDRNDPWQFINFRVW